jgi:hypothetical protein
MKCSSTFRTALAACLCLGWSPAQGQQAQRNPDLLSEIRSSRLPLSVSGAGVVQGEGWERLIADGGRAQFFVVGEQHGVAEIINRAAAMHERLAKQGYSVAAMEVGPFSTDRVEQLIRSRPGALEGFVGQPGHRGIFPFLAMREEVRLAEQFVQLSSEKDALWGLDQEYVGSAPLFVELLSRRQKNPAQRAAVARFASAVAANPLFTRDSKPADVEPLKQAFRGDAEALAAIDALRISGEIYAPFTIPGSNRYWANLTRENYMKANFASAFSKAERQRRAPPKVFMKFGASHAMRGFSALTAVPALGNFLAEWGIPRGFSMVNIMMDCASNAPGASCQPYFGTDHAIYTAASEERFTLFDLRPIRARLRFFPDMDAKTRELIQGFDYYLLIRDVTRATRVPDAAPGTGARVEK